MPYNDNNLDQKRHDKTTYNKLYTARVTKRLFDLLKGQANNSQQRKLDEKHHPFGQSDNWGPKYAIHI